MLENFRYSNQMKTILYHYSTRLYVTIFKSSDIIVVAVVAAAASFVCLAASQVRSCKVVFKKFL